MSLVINGLQNSGDAAEEYVVFEAIADVNINQYMVEDNTYDKVGKLSNVHRHPFHFPNQVVKKGECVVLFTSKGKAHAGKMEDGTKAYAYYWGSDAAIWNDDADAVLLMKVELVDTFKVVKRRLIPRK